MKETLETLFKFDRQLVGPGYDNALAYINTLIGLEIKEIPKGADLGTWAIPDEWIVREAWVKYKGKKIYDYSKNPLSLVVYSAPFKGVVSEEELSKHIFTPEEGDATPYTFKFYDREWGFSAPKKKLAKGDYEVFIDTEFKDGILKYGVHTIKGESDREILLFAHLDHPHQANDNLSGVVCLMDLVNKLKCKHTVKIVFCPETIGSQAYIYNEDLSNVEFVIAVDICGNDNSIMMQKSFDESHRINAVAHCALQMAGKQYRKGKFRTSIGSDETAFNDPQLRIPGILLTRWPYPEYHTDKDTPDRIDYQKIEETGDLIRSIIDIYERDYIPKRNFFGPLMRSRYNIQSPAKVVNLNFDYLFYTVDGKKSLAELACHFEMPFEPLYEIFDKIIKDEQISRIDIG
jgi:aminopeptidase-like protein